MSEKFQTIASLRIIFFFRSVVFVTRSHQLEKKNSEEIQRIFGTAPLSDEVVHEKLERNFKPVRTIEYIIPSLRHVPILLECTFVVAPN